MKRILYLGYYIKQMDWKKFRLFLNYTAAQTSKSKLSILIDVLISVFTYNACVGRSDDSIYKAALNRKAWGFSRPITVENYNFVFQCFYHRSY